MFIKNRKNYLIALLVSWIGMIVYFLGSGLFDSDIWVIALIIAVIASALCGSLNLYISLVKASFGKGGGITILSLPFMIMKWMWRILLIFWAITIGAVLLFALPGVYALIAYFKYRDELED